MTHSETYDRAIDALDLLGFRTSLEVTGETVVLRWWVGGHTRYRAIESAPTLREALDRAGRRALVFLRWLQDRDIPVSGVIAEQGPERS